MTFFIVTVICVGLLVINSIDTNLEKINKELKRRNDLLERELDGNDKAI